MLLFLQLEGYKYAGDDQKKDIRMRFFHTHQNIHPNHVFQTVVSPPTVDDRKPHVDWVDFHTTVPVDSLDTNHSGNLEELAGLWRPSGHPHCAWLAHPDLDQFACCCMSMSLFTVNEVITVDENDYYTLICFTAAAASWRIAVELATCTTCLRFLESETQAA